jgi:hypothetical protein
MQTSDGNAALGALYEVALTEGRQVEWLGASELALSIDVVSADGGKTPFELVVSVKKGALSFKERKPSELPAYCPNRHINGDGTFCLAAPWSRNELLSNPLAVLQKFLRLQLIAEREGKWPSKFEWAHGDAALHQMTAEEAAARLSQEWYNLLIGGKLKLRKHGNFLSVLGGQNRLAMWRKENRVSTLRQRCFCGQSKYTVVDCGSHANDAVELVRSLAQVEKAEARFWNSMKGHACCGTMKSCPLRMEIDSND